MVSKGFVFLGLLFAVVLLISSDEVKARELLVETSSVNHQETAEQVHHPNGVENPEYHGGGRGPYGGGYGGNYGGGHGPYEGGRGGNYGGGGRGRCRWGCCGGGWRCRCCTHAEASKN